MSVVDEFEIHSLLCHQHVGMAVICLQSLYRYSRGAFRLVLHDDGSLTDSDISTLKDSLPNCRVVGRQDLDELVREALSRYPACRALREDHVMGLKLFDTILDSRSEVYIYVDADVYFLAPWDGLFRLPGLEINAIFMRDSENGYCVGPREYASDGEILLPKSTNAGLCCFRRGSYDLDFLEWFLKKPVITAHRDHWLVEQTAWAAMAYRQGMAIWDSRYVRIPDRGPNLGGPIVAAHFAGSARALLSVFHAKAECGSAHAGAGGVVVPVTGAEPLRWYHLAATEFRRKATGVRRRLASLIR